MAKSKPIGVRFDLEKLELIQKEQNLKSPQAVLNYFMDNYGKNKESGGSMTIKLPKLDKIAAKLAVSKPMVDNHTKFYKEPVELTLNQQPQPPDGLKGIDLTIWKSENWK